MICKSNLARLVEEQVQVMLERREWKKHSLVKINLNTFL